MVVITDNTVLTLTCLGEQCSHYELLWKLSQLMRCHTLKPYIYDDETTRGIMWLIIGY